MTYRTTTRLLLTIALALALGSLLALPASAASLSELMKNCGIKYSGPDSGGVYQVEFEGDNVPLIRVLVRLTGEGSTQMVSIYSGVKGVPEVKKWDPAVFPWLLERSSELRHGGFILVDEGRQVMFLDRVPLSGLTSALLAEFLTFVVEVVDDSYPKVKVFVRN